MSVPKPPFHTVSEELLYNIYLKIQTMDSLKKSDINTLAKLNLILTDADLMKSDDIVSLVNTIKGNVPDAGNTLEKLFNIIQGLNYLKAEDIDTLAELNAILSDVDLPKTEDLAAAISAIKGNVPDAGNTLEKLFNIIQGLTYLKAEDIDTLAELNTILTDADLIKTEDLTNALNGIKGNVPVAGDTLEKLFNIIQGLTYLKAEDIDTLAELNAIITDADLIKTQDLQSAVDSIKGNVPALADTLEKIYNLVSPVLTAWVQDGNNVTAIKGFGTKSNFALPFITNNIERARLDTFGNFLLGHSGAVGGRLHIRAASTLEAGFSIYVDDPTTKTLLALANNGKLLVNYGQPNLLINGGWQGLTGLQNLIVTSGPIGGRLVDATNDNVVIGHNAAGSTGSNPSRAISRNIIIGSAAGSADPNGANFTDSVFIGYRAGYQIALNTGHRNTMVGGIAGSSAVHAGTDHTLIGYDSQAARSNNFNTLIGSGTKAYNSIGDLATDGSGQNYMTAIGAGAVVRTGNTLVLGRKLVDQIVIGAESNNQQLPGVSTNTGLAGYRLQVINPGGASLGVSGNATFRDGNHRISLGEEGNSSIKYAFRVDSYLSGGGGYEFVLSAANVNATLEITDNQFGGTRNEMLRLTPGGYANTAILIRPNDLYNTTYGYRYLLQGTNTGQQSRTIYGFHAQLNFNTDDAFPAANKASLYAAIATVKNHIIDGFYADVRPTDPAAQSYAFRSLGSRIYFDGNGMSFPTSVFTITTDASAHAGATNLLLNGSYVVSCAQYIVPLGAERTGIVLSPGNAQANGMFIGPQQALNSYNYNGYLLWVQYSTTGNNMLASTTKPLLFIRKHNALLNGFDHTGAFLRMEENIGSTGAFIEAYKFDTVSNSLKLKFSIDKEGILSIGQVAVDPPTIATVGRLYFIGEELKLVTPLGVVRTVKVL